MMFIVFLFSPVYAWSQSVTCEQLKSQYEPQSSPEETYHLELEMMKQGAYCHDLAIFDGKWQARASKNAYGDNYKTIAGYFDVTSEVYQEGKYAIIYYSENKTLGPVFLYREKGKWILDRSSVNEYIHYEDTWLAYDGNYPYLDLIKKVFTLEERVTAKGQKVFKVQ